MHIESREYLTAFSECPVSDHREQEAAAMLSDASDRIDR